MYIVLERVLKTTNGLRLSRKHHDNPRDFWRLHEQHQTVSATSARITTSLSQESANMKVAEFPFPTKFLDTFEVKLKKFNKLLNNTMPSLLAIGFLKTATHGNNHLLNAWASSDTITERLTPNATPTYEEYFEFLMSHVKKLEDSVKDNSSSRRANVAESNHMQPYYPSDKYYDAATNLSNYMEN